MYEGVMVKAYTSFSFRWWTFLELYKMYRTVKACRASVPLLKAWSGHEDAEDGWTWIWVCFYLYWSRAGLNPETLGFSPTVEPVLPRNQHLEHVALPNFTSVILPVPSCKSLKIIQLKIQPENNRTMFKIYVLFTLLIKKNKKTRYLKSYRKFLSLLKVRSFTFFPMIEPFIFELYVEPCKGFPFLNQNELGSIFWILRPIIFQWIIQETYRTFQHRCVTQTPNYWSLFCS